MELSTTLICATIFSSIGLVGGGAAVGYYDKHIKSLTSSYSSADAKCCYHTYRSGKYIRDKYYIVDGINCSLNDKVDCEETLKDSKKKKTDSIIATSVMGGLTALTCVGALIAKIGNI